MKIKKYLKFLNNRLKYDLMNYKFLKCNTLYTTENLVVYLHKKKNKRLSKLWKKIPIKIKKKYNLSIYGLSNMEDFTKKFIKLSDKEYYKRNYRKKKKLIILDEKNNTKKENKIFTKFFNMNKAWSFKINAGKESNFLKYKEFGSIKPDGVRDVTYTKKYVLLGKLHKFRFNKKAFTWFKTLSNSNKYYYRKKEKAMRLQFLSYLNYFNNELVLLNYKKEYLYNKYLYSIVHLHMTPNNFSIVVTRANGDIWFWETSGSRKFKGSRKCSLSAIKSVSRSIYYKLLRNKATSLKIVYKGRANMKRLSVALDIFKWGAKRNKYSLLAIINMTPLAYNGCMKPKKRR